MARISLVLAALLVASAPAQATIGENLIAQPTFDEGINGWDNLAGKLWQQQDDVFPLTKQPNPGSLEMLATDYVSQCVGIVSDETYLVRVFFKTMLTGDASGKAGISVHWYKDSFCETYLEGPYIHPFGYVFGATEGWKKIKLVGHAPLAAHGAKVVLGAEKTAGTGDSEMRVRFDEVTLAPFYDDSSTTTTTTEMITTTTDEPGAPGCADPVTPYDTTTVADALYVLKRSVGLVPCATCLCDTDHSGTTTAGDALRTLRLAVGQSVTKSCGACDS